MCFLGLLGTKLRNRICILTFSFRSLIPRFTYIKIAMLATIKYSILTKLRSVGSGPQKSLKFSQVTFLIFFMQTNAKLQ